MKDARSRMNRADEHRPPMETKGWGTIKTIATGLTAIKSSGHPK
jgi:hypothetical protein